MSESQVEMITTGTGLDRRVARAAIEATVNLDTLLANRSRLKALGDPRQVRKAIRSRVVADSIRLAIAEDVLCSATLYGDRMRAEYERRCAELGVEVAADG